jgi:hypothetical protein
MKGPSIVAETTHNDRARAWKISIQKLNQLNEQLDQCQPEDREALERAIAEQEEDVLDTSAPSYTALLLKLELLFSGQLEGLHPDAEYRRLVLEDLSELIAVSQELVGGAPDHLSGIPTDPAASDTIA